MTKLFWVKRGMLVLGASSLIIFGAQWLKSQDFYVGLTQAAIWAPFSTFIYLAVLWRKLQKNKSCAINYQKTDPAE
jgi:hypothetical protein